MSEWIRENRAVLRVPDRHIPEIWSEWQWETEDKARAVEIPEVLTRKGSEIRDAVIETIRSSKSMLVICSFLLGSEEVARAIEDASARGVRVYVMTAGHEQLQVDRYLDERDSLEVKRHIELLNRLAEVSIIRCAPGFHAKFILADPFDDGSGILLTSNLRDGAIVEIGSPNESGEIAVRLDGAAAAVIGGVSREAFWCLATHQYEASPTASLRALESCSVEASKSGAGIVVELAKRPEITEVALDLLRDPPGEVWVSSFILGDSHPVVDQLCRLATVGTPVTVILDPLRASARKVASRLTQSGCRVVGRPWIHAKVVSIESDRSLVHTLNFDDRSPDASDLNVGVLLEGASSLSVHQVLFRWASSARYRFVIDQMLSNLGMSVITGDRKPEIVDRRVVAQIELNDVVAQSADELDSVGPPPLRGDELTLEVEARWRIIPPVIGANAKPIGKSKAEGAPRLYRDGSRLVVAVESTDSLDEARALRQESGAEAIVVKRKIADVLKRK